MVPQPVAPGWAAWGAGGHNADVLNPSDHLLPESLAVSLLSLDFLPADPWALALGTVAVLALAGLAWRRWAGDARPAAHVPFDRPVRRAAGASGFHRTEPVPLAQLGEVQDRLGMQLLTARTLARSGAGLSGAARLQQVDRQLAQAQLLLRLMRDAQQTDSATLADSLAGLHGYFFAALQDAGIRLDWQVSPQVLNLPLTPRVRLPLLRIVQEALDNVLAHARGASVVRLSLTVESADARLLQLSIRDDGRTVGAGDEEEPMPQPAARGRGLVRLTRQADEIGARLAVGPAQRGWFVEVGVPIGG